MPFGNSIQKALVPPGQPHGLELPKGIEAEAGLHATIVGSWSPCAIWDSDADLHWRKPLAELRFGWFELEL